MAPVPDAQHRKTAPGPADEVGMDARSNPEGPVGSPPRTALMAGALAAAAALPIALYPGAIGDAALHTLIEGLCAVIAAICAAIGAVRYRTKPSDRVLLLACAIGGAAALDGYHAVVTSPWFVAAMPSTADRLIPWSWLASRLYLAVMMVGAQWWLLVPSRPALPPRRIVALAALVVLAVGALFVIVPVGPAMRPHGVGRPQDLLPAVLFLLALGLLLRRSAQSPDRRDPAKAAFLAVGAVAQLVMPASDTLFDGPFVAAHLLKLASYLVLFGELLVDVQAAWQREQALTAHIHAQAAELAQRNRELAQRNADLRQFAYAVSHDLKAPLRSVHGFAQLLERRYGDRLDDDGREFLQLITDGARRMQAMIDGLLEFARVERADPELVPVALGEVVAASLADLRDDIAARGARVEIREPLPAVRGDATLLRQLVQNLVSNAIKYCEGQPEVEIAARRDGDRVLLSVRDNGFGIPPEQRNRIFELFARLHTPYEYPGSGIGLAVCRRIAELHGGWIRVESTPGAGSTFTVSLPAA